MKSETSTIEFVNNVEEWTAVADALMVLPKDKDPERRKYLHTSFHAFQATLWHLMPEPLVKPHRRGIVPPRKIQSKDNNLLGKSIVDVLRNLLLDIQSFAKQVEDKVHEYKEGTCAKTFSTKKLAMEKTDRDLRSRINALIRLMCRKLC